MILALALGAGLVAAAPRGQPDERPLETFLQGRELDAVRSPDRVETFAVEDLLQAPAGSFPEAQRIATDLPGRFAVLPGPTPVAPALAREMSRLLLAPASYPPWMSACMFSPGVAIRFHRGATALDVFVCFHCRELAFQEVGASRALEKLVFAPVQEQLFELVKRARPADARLGKVRQQWDEEALRERRARQAEERWRAAMPRALQPFWEAMTGLQEPDLDALAEALAREIPDPEKRMRALLEWFGSGDGPWSGHPSYEGVAEELLLTYSTRDLLAAIAARPLSERQTEGAARLFGGWDFGQQRPQDRALLPRELRARLLEHSLASTDEDKRARARAEFEEGGAKR